MFEIVRGIPKPENLPPKVGSTKYPLAEMEVGESFVVPYSEMNEGESSEKFRGRIYQSARNYALRDFNQRNAEAGNSGKEVVKKEFTAAVMQEDDKSTPMKWAKGDVVVWRDK